MATEYPIISPKKLIEVALPLDAINAAAAREKSIRHGHPSTLHLWWARRPLAAARAVIFSQLVNDPEDLWRCQNPGMEPNKQVRGHWTKARARLFKTIEEIVLWENTTNRQLFERAHQEIRQSWIDVCDLNKNHPQAADLFNVKKLPGLHDPFAGGGSIPLEAQRLGLETYASDLNPVAVLINKSMIEIPPRFIGIPPVNPESSEKYGMGTMQWHGAQGIAEDVSYYGKWMRREAERRIGHLYPKVKITKLMVQDRPDIEPYLGQELTVIAWIWARTVKSPNPAFSNIDVPLASTFILSSKPGKESFVEPVLQKDSYTFAVNFGSPPSKAKNGTKRARGNFTCLMSQTPIEVQYIRDEAMAGRLGQKLMAVVAEGNRGRVYLSPTSEHEELAKSVSPQWQPEVEFFQNALGFRVGNYGMSKWCDLFTPRQLNALSTFCDLIVEARAVALRDAKGSGMVDDNRGLDSGGLGALAYAEAISVYLAFAIDKSAVYWNSLCPWLNQPKNEIVGNSFSRQTVQMLWDFAEANPLSDSGGNIDKQCDYIVKCLCNLGKPPNNFVSVYQANASSDLSSTLKFYSSDPPYYDNIGYADLSDFFYVWLRRSLREVFPTLFSTIAVPKEDELVATAARHGGRQKSERFFLAGMTQAMKNLSVQAHPAAPITIYYAFKQADTESEGTNSTGWETFLEAVNRAGLSLTGTWPMRTERPGRMRDTGSNALASSIILVCRSRSINADSVTRRQFIRELNSALPIALDAMTRESEELPSPVAPVDLSQAVIGPGMAVFSKYSAVLEADGTPMTVRTALQLINRFLAEDDFDADTQFSLHWFEQYGWDNGKFGEADTLARAKGTSVDGVKQAGVLHAVGGSVRLLKWAEYPSDWDPKADQRLPIWEVLHQLIRVFNSDGETGAAAVFAAVQSKAEAARQLAYRLYTLCERKNWAEDARAYNEVVTSWSGIETAAAKEPALTQQSLFEN
jgi:putative DNA methylase